MHASTVGGKALFDQLVGECQSNPHLRFRGKKYRLRRSDMYVLRLLARFAVHPHDPHDSAWLLRFRGDVRDIEAINPRCALTLVIDSTDEEHIRRLAIWLRGRCRGTIGAPTVSQFASSLDRSLRKDVTRCLKRLSAWSELRHIAETDPDAQIRRMARQTPSKPYALRLAGFVQHIPRQIFARRRSKLVVAPQVNVGQSHPPKPRWRIRVILERIRRLVRGTRG